MKTFIKLFIPALIVCIIVDSGIYYVKNLPHTYKEDYPVLYKEQLEIMFGSDYEIGEKKTIEIEAEDCSCGYHSDGYIYDEWDITYRDQNGYTYTQTLDNRNSLESQQIKWLKNQLSSYYKQKYFLGRFPENTFHDLSPYDYYGKSYCFIQIGFPVGSYTLDREEEYNRIKEKGNIYHEQLMRSLQDPQNMLHFYDLDYNSIFESFPIEISIKLSINDASLQGKEKESHEEELRKKVLKIMEELNRDSNNTCNLTMYISSDNGGCDLYDGSRSWRYYYLCGEWFEPKEGEYDYDWQLYYTYEGIFW